VAKKQKKKNRKNKGKRRTPTSKRIKTEKESVQAPSKSGKSNGESGGSVNSGRKPPRGKPAASTGNGRARSQRPEEGTPRRAFSTMGAVGRSGESGDRKLSQILKRALNCQNEKAKRVVTSFTHEFHTYPARMHPATARYIFESLATDDVRVILDPFCGSGTVLVEGIAAGKRVLGFDANPLAIQIARTKIMRDVANSSRTRKAFLDRVEEIVGLTIMAGKEARRAGYIAKAHYSPSGANRDRRDQELKHWFSPHVRRELECMLALIEEMDKDRKLKLPLRMVLSSILYKVSKRSSDTDKKQKQKQIGRGFPARIFRDRAKQLVRGLSDLNDAVDKDESLGAPLVYRADARCLSQEKSLEKLGDAKVDMVITSPPYPGTYDYAHHHDLRMSFFGIANKKFITEEMGARRSFAVDEEQLWSKSFKQWQRDSRKIFSELAKVLRSGGYMVMVMGDSMAGRHAIYADDELPQVMGRSFELVASAWQSRPLLGREKQAFKGNNKREHLFLLRRK